MLQLKRWFIYLSKLTAITKRRYVVRVYGLNVLLLSINQLLQYIGYGHPFR